MYPTVAEDNDALRRVNDLLKALISEKHRMMYSTRRKGAHLFQYEDGLIGALWVNFFRRESEEIIFRVRDDLHLPSDIVRVKGKRLVRNVSHTRGLELNFAESEAAAVFSWLIENYRGIKFIPDWLADNSRRYLGDLPQGSPPLAYLWTQKASDYVEQHEKKKRVIREQRERLLSEVTRKAM
jgi:hypothetical protein